MREFSDRASFINACTVQTVQKVLHLRPNIFSSFWNNLRNSLIAKLVGTDEAIVLFALINTKPYELMQAFQYMHTLGAVSWYGEVEKYNDYPKFHYFGARYHNNPEGAPDNTDTVWGFSTLHEGPEAAMIRTFGECLERYASYYVKGKKHMAPPRVSECDMSFLYPHIPHTSETQHSKNTFLVSSSDDMRNMKGLLVESLTGDRKRPMPASAFYWNTPDTTHERLFQDLTTSGSGGGFSRENATLSALYELIERDHFLLYWLTGVKPAQIHTYGISTELAELIETSRDRYGLEVYFFDLSYDLDVLTAACIVIDPKLNMITMGAKTGTISNTVLQGAFLEALAVLTVTRARGNFLSEKEMAALIAAKKHGGNVGRLERVNMYMSQKGIELVRQAFIGDTYIPFSEFKKRERVWKNKQEELDALLQMFKALIDTKGAGYHVYRHTFSSTLLDHFNYHAVHCFVPSFLKLYLNEVFCPSTSPRLSEFAAAKCPGNDTLTHAPHNPLPHFFP